jgi:transposase
VADHADDRAKLPQPPRSVADLHREIDRLRRELENSERARERLKRENDRLKKELATARRAGHRQAAPFSKGAPTAQPRRSGRRAGRRHGRHGHRRPPRQIDETIEVPLPAHCPACGGGVDETRVADQLQEELPVARPHVRRFRIHLGHCRDCGRRVQGRHPLQTTDALGAAATHLGPQAVALIVLLNKRYGLSHGKTAAVLREWFHLQVQPSGVTHALHRAARQAAPTYAQLQAQVRGSPMVSPDETSWKVGGRSWWLWAFVTERAVVYAIQPGRGFAQAATVLGADFGGVLVRDGWQGYRPFTAAGHQTCLAHLLRRCRELRDAHPRAVWPRRVAALLKAALRLRDRYQLGRVSPHGLVVARGHLTRRLSQVIAHAPTSGELYHFAVHLSREESAVFSFLIDPTVDATNWRAEQALRPAVVNRKVSGGNRTTDGAATQEILTTVVQTARLRGLSSQDVLVDLLQAPTPTPSPALCLN